MKVNYKSPLFLIFLGIILCFAGWCILLKTETHNPSITTTSASEESKHSCSAKVYFSPNGGCEWEIIRAIGTAKKQIRVLSYSFTSEPIAQALILLSMGGVDVQVVIDSGSAKRSEAENLVSNGVKVYLDSNHAIMHNKVIIIDTDLVLTGSYNYSEAASTRNAENLVIIRSKNLTMKYLENWEHHKSHSKLKEKW